MSAKSEDSLVRIALVVTFLAGLTIILFSGSIPFFRQTSVLQPFLFLFAAVAISHSAMLFRRLGVRNAVFVAGALAIGAIPALEAWQVFQAHLGFGKVLQWIDANERNRRICWLTSRVAEYSPAEYVRLFSPDDLVVTRSSLYSAELSQPLAAVPYLTAASGLWGTNAAYAETVAWNHSDLRKYRFYTEARAYKVRDVMAALPLPVFPPNAPPTVELTDVHVIPELEFDQDARLLMTLYRPYPDPLHETRVRADGYRLPNAALVVLDGQALPTRVDDLHLDRVHLIAAVPQNLHGCVSASVRSGQLSSNSIRICIP